MSCEPVLLITPPFVQSNTPYPATMYLSGFLKQNNVPVLQRDLSIQSLGTIFSSSFLNTVYEETDSTLLDTHFITQKQRYLDTLDDVITFLRGKHPTLAYRILSRNFLPEGNRFAQCTRRGTSSFETTDYARYLATLYIEDLFDFYRTCCDSRFGLTRYAESLALSLPRYAAVEEHLATAQSRIEQVYLDILDAYIHDTSCTTVGITIPFPGNLLPALRCFAYIKQQYPHICTIAGGGYVSTELRELSAASFFDTVDWLVYDNGEQTMLSILNKGYTPGTPVAHALYRYKERIIRGTLHTEKQESRPALYPDYTGIDPGEYLSLIDTENPMMRLWNDGFWNKMTIAYGCYWARCAFCDTTLEYIRNCAPLQTDALLDRIHTIRKQTGRSGFHFTDEAAPPSALKQMALRLIAEGTQISYWTNIRFEPAFSADLCRLLAFSGCIAVSGGIEVASDRLLQLIDKGVSVDDIVRTTLNLSQAGILVHAYLMYGFPTQTMQETVDALEIIRQLFLHGCIDSAYWHRFSLTRHSRVYQNADGFRISPNPVPSDFACNDIPYTGSSDMQPDRIGRGLNAALQAYMNHHSLERSVHSWFSNHAVHTTVDPAYVERHIAESKTRSGISQDTVLFIARIPVIYNRDTASVLDITAEGEQYSLACRRDTASALKKFFANVNIYDTESAGLLIQKLTETGIRPAAFFSSEIWHFLRELSLFVI